MLNDFMIFGGRKKLLKSVKQKKQKNFSWPFVKIECKGKKY